MLPPSLSNALARRSISPPASTAPASLSSRPAITTRPCASGAVVGGITPGALPSVPPLPVPGVPGLPVPSPVPGVVGAVPSCWASAPMLPLSRFFNCPLSTASACTPACSMRPSRLTSETASTSRRVPLSWPPRLSRSWPVRRFNSRPALTRPSLRTPPLAAMRVSSRACSLPVFSSRPSTVTTSSPVCAPRLPALRTPTPCSVPISRILLAYMPPSWATSSAYCGVLPSAAWACTRLRSALTVVAPVVTCSCCAHRPALSCTERAIRSV
ncbi:hypothetical protein D3C71_1198990 [compost metagenome]